MNTTIDCTTVIVKFLAKLGLPDQEVRAAQADAAKYLRISRDEQFLVVNYMTDQGFSIKQVNYSVPEIKEYACYGVLAPKPLVPMEAQLNTWKGSPQ